MSVPRYPKYKASGVEWLGDVPEHWEIVPLKYSARLLTAKTERREWPVALENIESWTGRFIPTETDFEGEGVAFDVGDILFGKLRPYLAKAYRADRAGEAVGDFHVLRPNPGAHGRFIQYQTLSREFVEIVNGSTFGSKMPRASWEFVGAMRLTRPPFREQSTIAAFLDRETGKIDDLVAEQRRLVELLKEKRQAVISHAVTKGLNPSAPMKPSGIEWLGDLPAHWELMAIKHGCTMIKDGTHLPPDRVDVGVPLLSVRNIVDDEFVRRDDDSMVSVVDYEGLCRAFVPRAGDVVMAIVGATLGKVAVIGNALGDFHVQRSLGVFRVRSDRLLGEYLASVFRSVPFQSKLWELVGYSAQPGIYLGTLRDLRIPVPPRTEQQAMVVELDRRCRSIDVLRGDAQRAIDLLQERRTALISAAVTGQIDVRGFADSEAA